jgi:hypothetical protein
MGTSIVVALVLIQASLTALPGPSSKESVQARTILQSPVHGYSVTADTFVDALLEAAGHFKLRVGVAWIRERPSEMRPVHLSWKDATVEEVIRDIAQAQPGYQVEVRNAVVHVRPRALIPDRENFLRLRIPRFEVQNEVAETASKGLSGLVSLELTPPRPAAAGQAGGGVASSQLVEVGDPEISISLANVTVEDGLDAISLVSPFKVWIVTFAGGGSLTPGGFRRTVLAVADRPVPDERQPVWEFLKWGRKPY